MTEIKQKYVIKNCPCYWHIGEDDGCSLENLKNCEDDNNCIIKQVIEKCKEHPFKDCACGDEILQLFEIEVLEDSEDENS